MRTTALLITGLLMGSTPAMAKDYLLQACFAEGPKPNGKNFAQGMAWIDHCLEEMYKRGAEEAEAKPSNNSSYRNSPDSSYYDFQAWKANEDYKRDVEAINRDYDLRRSGVLP